MTRPSKAVIAALGRVFEREINGTLPFQSKAAIYRTLLAGGQLSWMTRFVGSGWSQVEIKGYALTDAGRLFYCQHCGDDNDDAQT